MSLSNNKKGRPIDWTTPARAKVKQLRSDAKRLETIAKNMRNEANYIMNEIKVIQANEKKQKSDFFGVKSSILDAGIFVSTMCQFL